MKNILVKIIGVYKKYISPYLIRSCRFTPTCSEYAMEAINKFGIARGIVKAAWRILRCNPFSKGGFDPVR